MTPLHPVHSTYTQVIILMIENAIKELNEEGGGPDEKAISKFILAEYKDLPWAHPAFLNHHLKRLSKTGNLTQNHYKLSPSPSPSPSPVSCFSLTYASSDSSASSQSFVQERRRKKKIKRNCRKKRSQRQKKRINARGMINCCHGKQVGGDIGLDGMKEVDIQSLLTEDEDEANIHAHLQQQIIVFEHEHGMNIGGNIAVMQQNMGDDHDCSTPTPTTFPEKTKRIRNSNSRGSKHRKHQMRRGKREREAESNMNVETMEGGVNGVDQDSMDEQVYGGEPTDVQRKESGKVLFQQNHYCPTSKPRPRPYRNVADIYESSSTATRNTN